MVSTLSPTAGLPPLLTNAADADLLQIKERLLRELVARRELPCVRVGDRLLRYRRSDLEAYLEAKSIPALCGPLAEAPPAPWAVT